MPEGPDYEILTEKVAIDCEMMRSNVGQVLGRVSKPDPDYYVSIPLSSSSFLLIFSQFNRSTVSSAPN